MRYEIEYNPPDGKRHHDWVHVIRAQWPYVIRAYEDDEVYPFGRFVAVSATHKNARRVIDRDRVRHKTGTTASVFIISKEEKMDVNHETEYQISLLIKLLDEYPDISAAAISVIDRWLDGENVYPDYHEWGTKTRREQAEEFINWFYERLRWDGS